MQSTQPTPPTSSPTPPTTVVSSNTIATVAHVVNTTLSKHIGSRPKPGLSSHAFLSPRPTIAAMPEPSPRPTIAEMPKAFQQEEEEKRRKAARIAAQIKEDEKIERKVIDLKKFLKKCEEFKDFDGIQKWFWEVQFDCGARWELFEPAGINHHHSIDLSKNWTDLDYFLQRTVMGERSYQGAVIAFLMMASSNAKKDHCISQFSLRYILESEHAAKSNLFQNKLLEKGVMVLPDILKKEALRQILRHSESILSLIFNTVPTYNSTGKEAYSSFSHRPVMHMSERLSQIQRCLRQLESIIGCQAIHQEKFQSEWAKVEKEQDNQIKLIQNVQLQYGQSSQFMRDAIARKVHLLCTNYQNSSYKNRREIEAIYDYFILAGMSLSLIQERQQTLLYLRLDEKRFLGFDFVAKLLAVGIEQKLRFSSVSFLERAKYNGEAMCLYFAILGSEEPDRETLIRAANRKYSFLYDFFDCIPERDTQGNLYSYLGIGSYAQGHRNDRVARFEAELKEYEEKKQSERKDSTTRISSGLSSSMSRDSIAGSSSSSVSSATAVATTARIGSSSSSSSHSSSSSSSSSSACFHESNYVDPELSVVNNGKGKKTTYQGASIHAHGTISGRMGTSGGEGNRSIKNDELDVPTKRIVSGKT